ncbi:MAG: hypothetical protein ACF8PN_02315 [Phycisphaerales bacterium]
MPDHHEIDEGPSEADLKRFGEHALIECYECGEEMFDAASVCPSCGAFQIHPASTGRRNPLLARPWLIVVVAVILALGLVLWSI